MWTFPGHNDSLIRLKEWFLTSQIKYIKVRLSISFYCRCHIITKFNLMFSFAPWLKNILDCIFIAIHDNVETNIHKNSRKSFKINLLFHQENVTYLLKKVTWLDILRTKLKITHFTKLINWWSNYALFQISIIKDLQTESSQKSNILGEIGLDSFLRK